jgi:hypothetical protein
MKKAVRALTVGVLVLLFAGILIAPVFSNFTVTLPSAAVHLADAGQDRLCSGSGG